MLFRLVATQACHAAECMPRCLKNTLRAGWAQQGYTRGSQPRL